MFDVINLLIFGEFWKILILIFLNCLIYVSFMNIYTLLIKTKISKINFIILRDKLWNKSLVIMILVS